MHQEYLVLIHTVMFLFVGSRVWNCPETKIEIRGLYGSNVIDKNVIKVSILISIVFVSLYILIISFGTNKLGK